MYQKEHAVHAHGHGLITRAVAAGLLFCDGLGVYTTKRRIGRGFLMFLEIEKQSRRDRAGETKKNRQTKRVEFKFVFVFYFGTFFSFPDWPANTTFFKAFSHVFYTSPSTSSASFSTSPACPANIPSITSKSNSYILSITSSSPGR